MELVKKSEGSTLKLSVIGDVASIEDTAELKAEINKIFEEKSSAIVDIVFEDAASLSSALLGFLLKIIQGDKRSVTIYPKNESLYKVLGRINLIDMLNVKKL